MCVCVCACVCLCFTSAAIYCYRLKSVVGYEEGSTMLCKTASIRDFVFLDVHLQLLFSVNKLVLMNAAK